MAIIRCTECGREISDKAQNCPHCGCPLSTENMTYGENDNGTPESTNTATKKKGSKTLLYVIICAILAGAATFLIYKLTQNNKKEVKETQVSAPVKQVDSYDLDVRLLTEADIADKTKNELRLMRNEIYARHGYIFQNPKLQEYFNKKPWYKGETKNAGAIKLNDIENKNVIFIKKHE